MTSATENRQPAKGFAADPVDVLRRFHYGEPAAVEATTRPEGDVLPALLDAYRDASTIRYQYPLYLAPDGSDSLATPMSELLSQSLDTIGQARILKDNLPWLERFLRQRIGGPDPVDASALFAQGAAALQEHLDLKGDNRDQLAGDLEVLGTAFADGGRFLAYGPHVSLHLLLHAIVHRDNRAKLRHRVDRHIHGLRSLLQVEQAKAAGEPGSVSNTVGHGSRYFDTDSMSDILAKRAQGSVEMSDEQRLRVERALRVLQDWQDDPVMVRFVGRLNDPWFARQPALELVDSGDPCKTAADVFSRDAERFARLFAAMRIASLEIEGRYNPTVHDSWFASFDWQAFSDEELQYVPRTVALVSADHLGGDGLPSFSRLLGSRLPVHILSAVRAYDNPAAKPGEQPFDAYRFELAYFGIGHRQVVVAQSSAARHQDMLSGFLCALDSNRTSLHLINRGTQSKSKKRLLEPWFVASAALESRAHPFVLVNPDAGDHAAERIRFDGNPQPENDWPIEKFEYRDSDGDTADMELAFTFADYALLIPALHDHFRMVPKGLESPDLITIDRYLALEDELVDRSIPHVWGIDNQGELVRLVVSRALAFACRDRLNYWRTLQELAGIHNFYVEEAIDRVIAEQQEAIRAEREQLEKAHAEELENVRSEAAGEAMGQLVDVLMGADLSDMVGAGSQLASMPAAIPAEAPVEVPEPVETPVEESAAVAEEAELSFDEPWLDTAMCTTCDDCMGINKMMFVYNEDRQAIIRDPRAGSYADLVEAAEICPAKCIHPGKPLDPNEPGLDELIARAEPFN